MAQNRSQVYDVDNRYSQTRDASDNDAGKRFLRRFIQEDKVSRYPDVESERKEDNRFIEAVPLAQSNTYGRGSFRNQFKAKQGSERRYTTIKDSEKTDYKTSLGEIISENIRSIYRPDSKYTKDARKQYYSN